MTNKQEVPKYLLGRFGESVDAQLASGFQDHADDLVANVACETMVRLSDPMLCRIAGERYDQAAGDVLGTQVG